MLCTMLQKSQNLRRKPCDSFQEVGSHVCVCVCVQAATVCDKAMGVSVKISHTLLDAGCDVSQTTNVGKTPVSLALQQVRVVSQISLCMCQVHRCLTCHRLINGMLQGRGLWYTCPVWVQVNSGLVQQGGKIQRITCLLWYMSYECR